MQSYAGSVGTQSRERVDEEWEAKKAAAAAVRIPQRKPVPGSRGRDGADGYGENGVGEGPWVELPVIERKVEVS